MFLYHNGAAILASALREGVAYVARASILEEDGESTSLGTLGMFASERAAMDFAVRTATAFVDGEPLPKPPFETQ